MASAKFKIPSFVLKVLAPSVAAVASVALLLLYVVNGIFAETNRLDAQHAERLAMAAAGSLREGLETIAIDNAAWDDAAKFAGRDTVDKNWADTAWGAASAQGAYDAVFVVNSNGLTLYAARDGKRVPDLAREYLGAGLDKLVARAASGGANFRSGHFERLSTHGEFINSH